MDSKVSVRRYVKAMLRCSTTAPPEALADWHVEHLRTTGALHRLVRGHR